MTTIMDKRRKAELFSSSKLVSTCLLFTILFLLTNRVACSSRYLPNLPANAGNDKTGSGPVVAEWRSSRSLQKVPKRELGCNRGTQGIANCGCDYCHDSPNTSKDP
ncbi:unnamed protein product [Calypogeia fissa]